MRTSSNRPSGRAVAAAAAAAVELAPAIASIAPRLTQAARAALAMPAGVPHLGDAPRAFRPGVPALDLFPIATWARYVARSHDRARVALLEAADPAGHRGLREAIASHVAAARGLRCTADRVFITTGMTQTLDEVLRLVVEPGAPVWIEDPGYLGTRRAVVAAGARAVPVRVDVDGLDVAAGLAKAPRARAAIVTPSHHYPLGVTMSLARRAALLAWAARARAIVVEDDYDSEFRHRGRPLMSLAGLDAAGSVVYAGTFSKTMYPGLRIGFAVVPAALVDAYAAARRAAGNPASILEQDALAAFIADGHFARHIRRMRIAYRERAEAFADALRAECAPLLALGPCDAGMHACATLGAPLGSPAQLARSVQHGASPAQDGASARRAWSGRLDRRPLADTVIRDAAAARGIEVGALSSYCFGPSRVQGLVFGFGGIRVPVLRAACRELAAALAACRAHR